MEFNQELTPDQANKLRNLALGTYYYAIDPAAINPKMDGIINDGWGPCFEANLDCERGTPTTYKLIHFS